jgi:hypothetical protein
MRRGFVTLFALSLLASQASANQMTEAMHGDWSGSGTLRLTSGESERIRCHGSGWASGNSVSQDFRCASTGNTLYFSTTMHFSGNNVSGEWRGPDRGGTLSGQATASQLRLRLTSASGSGDLTATVGQCSQSLRVTGWSDELRSLSVDLQKEEC